MTINFLNIDKELNFEIRPIFKYVYFLPNHDIKWAKNVLRELMVKNSPDFRLLVVGYYYGAIAKTLFPKTSVTVVDADPLAILANAYVVWLKHKSKKYGGILKLLFLDFYRLNKKINRAEVFLSKERYEQSLSLFKEFIRENFKTKDKIRGKVIKHLYNEIFRIKIVNDYIILMLAPKGFCADILKLQLEKIVPDNVIVDDIAHIKTFRNFDAVMTNNSIDFTKNKKYFLEKIKSLTKSDGLIEVSSYSDETTRLLKHLGKNKNIILGSGVFWQLSANGSMHYITKLIRMGQITYILKP